ncbi:MAG TPA: NAD(P)-dependent oxidoreductase [Streptosporangiaceae bacterium]|nr:NAD(P)-dependent oxidoreductase [Streptosporangiaceae bacterium]
MSGPVIAVADTAFGDHAGLEKDFGEQAELRWIDLTRPDTVPESTAGADAVVVTLQRLTTGIIAAFAPSVRVIGRAGVGLDTIDLETAGQRGVAVFNQPAYGAAEVATHALALLLALERRLRPADAFVRAGWQGPLDLGRIRALDDATAGIIGGGRIGQAFAERVRPLVREVLVYDPAPVSLPPHVERVPSLAKLLARSDVISLHLPLVPATRGLIGRDELRQLPAGAMVINVARGGIIDEGALAELLHSGHLAGAGLDVYATEPLPADSPLLSTPNTLLTPHSASVSERSAHRLSHWTIGDAIEYLASGSVTHGSMVVQPAN